MRDLEARVTRAGTREGTMPRAARKNASAATRGTP